MNSSEKPALVMLHGWGVNRRIWEVATASGVTIREGLSRHFEVHLLDLPGYGEDSSYLGGYDLRGIAERILAGAPEHAVWVAWSLGATIAMQCALQEPERILALQLISPTPRFLSAEDWPAGVAENSLLELKQRFERGYASGLKYFLMLQTTDRKIVRWAADAISQLPEPSFEILWNSLDLLANSDLRRGLSQLHGKVQIVVGEDDRVVPPEASRALYEILTAGQSERSPEDRGQLDLVRISGGHLCFLESEQAYLNAVERLTGVACDS